MMNGSRYSDLFQSQRLQVLSSVKKYLAIIYSYFVYRHIEIDPVIQYHRYVVIDQILDMSKIFFSLGLFGNSYKYPIHETR